jgi:hypothetical protein
MGYYYPQVGGRRALIEYLCETEHYRTKARFCSGNVLWIWHTPKDETVGRQEDWIGCYLLHRSDTGYWGGVEWGYKPMDESVHPFYYSCPKSWFDSVPVACQEWREGVKAHWERRAERRRAKRKTLKRPTNSGAKTNPYANLG